MALFAKKKLVDLEYHLKRASALDGIMPALDGITVRKWQLFC